MNSRPTCVINDICDFRFTIDPRRCRGLINDFLLFTFYFCRFVKLVVILFDQIGRFGEIEFLQDVLHVAAAKRLAYFRRPVIVTRLAPWVDPFQQLKLLFFEGAQPLFYLGY